MVYGLIYLVYRWSDLTTSLDINLYQYHNNWGGVGVSIFISKCRLVFDTRGGGVYFNIKMQVGI